MSGDAAAASEEWMEFTAEIGARLKAARLAKGLSQEKAAREINIATFTYQKMEKGLARPGAPLNPRLTTLLSLCRALDLALDELIPEQWPKQIPSVERGPQST